MQIHDVLLSGIRCLQKGRVVLVQSPKDAPAISGADLGFGSLGQIAPRLEPVSIVRNKNQTVVRFVPALQKQTSGFPWSGQWGRGPASDSISALWHIQGKKSEVCKQTV